MLLSSTLRFHLHFYSRNPIKISPTYPILAAFRNRIGSCRILMAMNPSFLSSSRSSGSSIGCCASDGVEGGGVASRFWLKTSREAIFAKYTRFVVAMASGILDTSAYKHYILQDFHFLKAFAHAYELAYDCADDDDAKEAISNLRSSVIKELNLHNTLANDWGVDLSEGDVNPSTIKYTDFLLSTATGKVDGIKSIGRLATPFERTKVAAYTISAMTPCMRLYAFIGKELQPFITSSHPYKHWVDAYSSDAFSEAASQIEDLLDKLSVSLTGEELDVMEHLYLQAMKLEIEFFNAQPLSSSSNHPLAGRHVEDKVVVFSDFDLTCTVVDSSAILAEIAIRTGTGEDLRATWDSLSAKYTEEYEQCIEGIVNREAVEFDYDVLYKALEPLSEFEKSANTMVVESGVLKGVNLEDVRKAGEKLQLQNGCVSFFRRVGRVRILSYCWCGDLVRSALGGVDDVEIYANEFVYEEMISNGEIVRHVESPWDKVAAFDRLKEDGGLSVYIGDSLGDLLGLVRADVGIVVGNSASLRRVGERFGVRFEPLFDGLIRKEREGAKEWKPLSGVLYTVRCWAEIHALVLGW